MSLSKLLGVSVRLFKGRKATYSCIFLSVILGLTAGCQFKTKSEAIQDYKAKGKTAKIIPYIHDPQQAIRLEAIEALVDLRASDAVAPFGSLFSDLDLVVVHAAVDGMAAIGGAEIEPYMLEAIKLKSVPPRITAAKELGNFKSEASVDALIIALDDYKYKDVVLAAINSLGQIGNPRAVKPLANKIQERSYDIREACIEALRTIGGTEAIRAISTRQGDVNDEIRASTVSVLIEGGEVSEPFALEELRSKNRLGRVSAIQVLQGIDRVPQAGNDLVWYHLAALTGEKDAPVDPDKAAAFDPIEGSVLALLEGLVHPEPEIRDYASIALENRGERVVSNTLAQAEATAGEKAGKWLAKRDGWQGAPSWHLDLWAATTSLNPIFNPYQLYVEELTKGRSQAEKIMKAEQFRPVREIIPYLLPQLADSKSDDEDKITQAERCRKLAVQHLVEADYHAVFPLIAALGGSDESIAVESARVLNTIGGERVEQLVVDEYFRQFDFGDDEAPKEESVAEKNAGETGSAAEPPVVKSYPLVQLSGTPLHLAIFEFDIPALEPLKKSIRPCEAVAMREFKMKHSDMTVISLPVGADPLPNAVPVHLSYYKNDQMNDLKIVYRRKKDNTWYAHTPIPDELP
jgi:HEAT repeat protein